MALTHEFVSGQPPDADSSLVDGPRWDADHVVDGGGITMAATTAVPATPVADKMSLFARKVAERSMPAFIGSSGLPSFLQPSLSRNKVGYWSASGNTTTAPISTFGISAPVVTGTHTARNVATTSFFSSIRRHGVVSAATAGSNSRIVPGSSQFWRGNAPGLGGFFTVLRWGCSDAATVAGARTFAGMYAGSMGVIDPSSAINIVGVGTDATDTNLQIIHNDGAGTATKIDLGADFPDHTLSVDMYEIALFCAPNGSEIFYEVTRLNTGHVARGTLNSNLPVNTSFMAPQCTRNNGATALAVGIDFVSMYIETDN